MGEEDAEDAEGGEGETRDYMERIQIAMKFLSDNPDEYLSPDALNTYSPKFARVLENLDRVRHVHDPRYARKEATGYRIGRLPPRKIRPLLCRGGGLIGNGTSFHHAWRGRQVSVCGVPNLPDSLQIGLAVGRPRQPTSLRRRCSAECGQYAHSQ